MSRVLIPDNGAWFDELKAVAYYGESDLERSVRQHVVSLFPDYYVFPFKTSVTSTATATTKRPDLAMVRRDLAAWGIVEVELAEHNLKHVLDQTRVFLDGSYNAPEIAEYTQGKLQEHCAKKVALKRLKHLFLSERPIVLVIADSLRSTWQEELNKLGVNLCIFEIYKNTNGHHLYRTFGQYPAISAQEAHCRRHESLVNVFEVVGDFAFSKSKLNARNEIDVWFDEVLTRWSLFEDGGKRYLRFIGTTNPLSPNTTYGLFADKSHNYRFKRS